MCDLLMMARHPCADLCKPYEFTGCVCPGSRHDVKLLLVQDAGGSTGLYRVSDGYLFAPEKEGVDGRPVCSVVCIKRKNKTTTPKEENKMSKKVFIGIGHGGSDSGAVGDIVEKEANLAMALACRDYLTAHGVEVRMSRTKDEEDPINEEVRECNAYAPDLAIDVHNNSGGGDGFEVFHTLNGGVGKTLAQNIEKQVVKIGQNSRGCKTRRGQRGDYYAFVRDTKCPAVICEGVFVDTKADAAQAGTKAKQQAFGIAYAKGILDTLGIKYDTSTAKPAEPVTDAETQAAIIKVQQAVGLSDKTMQYLLDYEYGVELVKKLAAAMK
ncbi:MAG: N-acetylmuramoyl-L-alanine amidase [Butyricicoccaceae bacterium]